MEKKNITGIVIIIASAIASVAIGLIGLEEFVGTMLMPVLWIVTGLAAAGVGYLISFVVIAITKRDLRYWILPAVAAVATLVTILMCIKENQEFMGSLGVAIIATCFTFPLVVTTTILIVISLVKLRKLRVEGPVEVVSKKKEDDRDLGYIMNLRKVVGHRPLIMPGAGVFVINDKDEILLEKRADNGMWDFPAGAMELGESFEECARREVLEETGIRCGELELFGVVSGKEYYNVYPNGDQAYFCGIKYICRDYSGELKMQESEVTALRFFAFDKLPDNMKKSSIEWAKKVSKHLKENA